MKAAVLTVSDKGFKKQRVDTSGPVIKRMLCEIGAEVKVYDIVPDEAALIKNKLVYYADELSLDIVVTTGGTGVSPRDVTPEATKAVIQIDVPGIAEAMRMESFKKTPHAVISRGYSGIRNKTLIINLPGSPKAAEENLRTVLPALPHAVSKIKGDITECGG